MYPPENIPSPDEVGCIPGHIIMQNIGALHNLSVEYIGMKTSTSPVYHLETSSSIGTVTIDLKPMGPGPPLSYLNKFLRDQFTLKLLCCKKYEDIERATFSFLFWTIPFDISFWILLTASVLALMILYKKQWHEVIACVLLRQSFSNIDANRTMVIYIFVSIVITCTYESIISSFVIVPSPIVVHKFLKHLIYDGYKLFGYYHNKVDQLEIPELKEQLDRENISNLIDTSLIKRSWSPGVARAIRYLANCNASSAYNKEDVVGFKVKLSEKYPRIKCDVVSDVTFSLNQVYTFGGRLVAEMVKTSEVFRESGILLMLDQLYFKFLTRYEVNRKFEILIHNEEKLLSPFHLSDPKIMAVYIICASLLVLSLVMLCFEILVKIAGP
jgi:hypothetical protein